MEHIEPPPIRRRTDIDIVVEIMSHLKREPSRKQRIMNACNISHKVLVGYIDKLIKKDYVRENIFSTGNWNYYTLSTEGNAFLLKIKESLALVQEVLEAEG